MKKVIILLSFLLSTAFVNAQTATTLADKPNPKKKLLTVEVSCGECKFNMDGKGCDLAVRINGKAYFVEGTNIDDHGDAHAENGFCEAIRKAQVQGQIKKGKFYATYFKLLDEEKKK